MALIDQIKLLKGIQDDLQDELLELIIDESEQRILGLINSDRKIPLDVLPKELDYIIRDVSIKRFNKLNSEGATADSEEGRSFNWENSYLSEYESILYRYTDSAKENEKSVPRRGIARFY